MTKVLNVAQYIYDYYLETTKDKIDELKLHKLLYFCQREKLALVNEPLFEEDMEGWVHGPVSTETRAYYVHESGINYNTESLSDEDAYIVRNIIEQYGNIASWRLRDMSHEEISWKNSRLGLTDNERGNRKIKLEDIKKDAEKVRPFDSVWGMYYDEFDDIGTQ